MTPLMLAVHPTTGALPAGLAQAHPAVGATVEVLWVAVATICAGAAGWLLGAGDRGARRARALSGAAAPGRRRTGPPGSRRLMPGRWALARMAPRTDARPVSVPAAELGDARRRHHPSGGRHLGSTLIGAGRQEWTEANGAASSGAVFGGAPAGAPLWLESAWSWAVRPARLGTRWGLLCLLVGGFVALLGDSVLPLLLGVVALPVARRAAKAAERRTAEDRQRAAVIALCGALAGEVRAGRHPGEALLVAAQESDGLVAARAAVLAAARFGGDVPAALSGAARQPGAEGLLGLAACWRVAVDSGAGLAAGLERLEAALRAERDQRAELRAQLAGARTTAVLLAVLPVVGLLLGSALGADPVHVLLHSGAGLGCLLVGGVLESVGLWWVLRIVRNGEST